MTYDEADEEVFAVVQERGAALWATLKTTAFPKTYSALFSFCAKVNFLKTAMFDMVESENPYAFKALLRCFYEHYLKFTYVFIRFVRERSDAVGSEYLSYCGAAEARDYAHALGLLGNLTVGKARADAKAVREQIDKFYPEAASLSEQDLSAESGKFRYRSILRFLSGENLVTEGVPFLANIVPEYAELSSFVHGGPWTDMDMRRQGDLDAAVQECRTVAGLVTMMSASVHMFTALAVSREFPEQRTLADEIDAIRRRFEAVPKAGEGQP